MNELHEAYKILELPPGADWAAVKKKYRLLSTVWHPDRMASEDFKKQADDKLKAINNARDVLKKHFETSHKDNDCDCQEQDPELYKKKEEEARQRFHKEQEQRRHATQAEERQARARDEARRAKDEEAQAEQQAASARAESFPSDLEAAHQQAQKLQDHETYLKYTVMALKVFGATCLILAINLGLVSWKMDHLKKFEPRQQNDYYDLHYKYEDDKAKYLEEHIHKSMGSYKAELMPPFETSYMKILNTYLYPPQSVSPNPAPIQQEPTPTQEDRNDIGNLEGQYATRASYIAKKEKLQDMLKKLDSAMTRTSDPRITEELNAIYRPTAALLEAAKSQVDFVTRSITEKENRIIQRLGRKWLPKQTSPVSSIVISTEATYNSAVSRYPELFK